MGAFFVACVASVRRPAPASVAVVVDAAAPLVEAASTPLPPEPLAYAEAIRRFPEMAAFPRPQELADVEWLKGVETVRLWVDRSELWPGAPRSCSAYAFHRDHTAEGRGKDWVAPRPRAEDADALLRLRTYVGLESAGEVEVLGETLVVHPDRLAYVGVAAHLAARCEWDVAIERPGCTPVLCGPCSRIRFYDVASPGSSSHLVGWSPPPMAYRVKTVVDPTCSPCDPDPRASELRLAQITAARTQVLHEHLGPIFFRTAAACYAHLREPRDDP